MRSLSALTPVEEVRDDGTRRPWPFARLHVKRDDLFQPFAGISVGGGKLRQLLVQIEARFPKTKALCTYASVHSPQAAILALVARETGRGAHVVIGAHRPGRPARAVIDAHAPLAWAHRLGAQVHNIAGTGFNSVLRARAKQLCEKRGYGLLDFGFGFERDGMLATARQVRNLPRDTTVVVVPTGSGSQLAGIVLGLHLFRARFAVPPPRVVAIQISGYDRRPPVDRALRSVVQAGAKVDLEKAYVMAIDRTYAYVKPVPYALGGRIPLNPYYESKAALYMLRHLKQLGIRPADRVLFWIVGDNRVLYRHPTNATPKITNP